MGRHRPIRQPLLGAILALLAVAAAPAMAIAHPLGNFTINHYAGLRVEPDRVLLDVVIDMAEIPAFQERITFDTDADGSVSDAEVAAGRVTGCADLRRSLRLAVDGAAVPMTQTAAGLSFPLGSSGLATMRLVCGYEAPVTVGDAARRIVFDDASYPDRLGWREIVVTGSEVAPTVVEGTLRTESVSARLTAYPEDLVEAPLADVSIAIDIVAGGPALPAAVIGDASPVVAAMPDPSAATAAVPGGISGELPAIFAATDLTPAVVLLAFLAAASLGAAHALTPGHGKTLMAAYLVGTRGTPAHALGLGLSVSASHTIGILVLAGVVVGAADVLPPDVVVRGAPVVAAISILAIGAWMLAGELRRRRSLAADRYHHEHDQHEHVHAHGGIAHAHAPSTSAGSSITWRGLFALGLAGGLIPSTSALLILLGSIAAGRPAFGLVLVVAFGLGMATVMAGIGLLIVAARDRVDRIELGGGLARARATVPLAAAILVTGFGVWLTYQAIAGAPTL